jgi:hypothetical protein
MKARSDRNRLVRRLGRVGRRTSDQALSVLQEMFAL